MRPLGELNVFADPRACAGFEAIASAVLTSRNALGEGELLLIQGTPHDLFGTSIAQGRAITTNR
jgi:hypothetical protein